MNSSGIFSFLTPHARQPKHYCSMADLTIESEELVSETTQPLYSVFTVPQKRIIVFLTVYTSMFSPLSNFYLLSRHHSDLLFFSTCLDWAHKLDGHVLSDCRRICTCQVRWHGRCHWKTSYLLEHAEHTCSCKYCTGIAIKLCCIVTLEDGSKFRSFW